MKHTEVLRSLGLLVSSKTRTNNPVEESQVLGRLLELTRLDFSVGEI